MADEDLDIAPDSDGWDDLEEDVEELTLQCLFCDSTSPDLGSFLKHGKSQHSFDLIELKRQHALDFYGLIKLVNFVRSEVKAGKPADTSVPSRWADDFYLQPVLDGDAVLFSLDDLNNEHDTRPAVESTPKSPEDTIRHLKQQLADLRSQFDVYREQVSATLDKRWQDNDELIKPSEPGVDQYDNSYFEGYAGNNIHQIMLQDTVRTDAYRDFIYENKHLFKDKVVLDVGCGTGILSMFCAKAGARKVIAVDNSGIIDKARQIAADNDLLDRITFVKRKVEEIDVLPDGLKHVDIIVSEWMGYCLLFEAMLPSVLVARDRFLKRAPDGKTFDGLIAPSHCNLQLAPLCDPEWISENITFWHDVYGFDMRCMLKNARDDIVVSFPPAETVFAEATNRHTVKSWNLYETHVDDLSFKQDFEVKVSKDADSLDAWCIWFDIEFSPNKPSEQDSNHGKTITFTTAPQSKYTHWQTGVCVIERVDAEPTPIKQGTLISGTYTYAKGEESRALEIGIEWKSDGNESGQQLWKMR